MKTQVSVEHKVVFVHMMFVLIVLFVILVVRYLWTLPQLKAVERLANEKDLARVHNVIENRVDELAVMTYDYAVWDDSYAFVSDKVEDYIDTNFIPETYESLRLSGVYIFNMEKELVWGEGFDRESTNTVAFPYFVNIDNPFLDKIITQSDERKANKFDNIVRRGIIYVGNKPFVFAASSILPSTGVGIPRGTMLFVSQILHQDEVRLSDLAAIDLEFIWPSEHEYERLLSLLNTEEIISPDAMDGYLVNVLYTRDNRTPYFVRFEATKWPYANSLFDVSILIAILFAFVSTALLYWFVHVKLIRPIKRWQEKMREIVSTGDFSLRFDTEQGKEITEISRSFNHLMAYVAENERLISEKNKLLSEISERDSLTKLYNRRYFDHQLARYIENNHIHSPFCVSLIDIDYFKLFNDNYGHLEGDRVLKTISKILMDNTKRVSDVLARYGGEEFIVLLKDTSLDEGMTVINTLCKRVFDAAIVHEFSPLKRVTISAGVACSSSLNKAELAEERLINRADNALYEAKRSGKNCVVNASG
ncbi:diguanylate cyclase [Aestuariibacter sp. AA17]|uniref:diguanylate cyclase n=1 Tax=Fluctibacter corallii TaxID=2984329 RepID=A0ABT3A5M8_9ALTE|nr:diguanylate cyclase [Aestuariibacter sp. AA17]MCV2883991.1 diguanylate cyclase [Aestuariibacter sp. AA17]